MVFKTVNFYREPAGSSSNRQKLDIDLLDLSRAAAKETLQTGVHVRPWVGLFREALTSDHDIRWRSNGLGQGRELRRSFSNILGRFVARYYLESQEQVIELVPIDGDEFKLSGVIVRKMTGYKGDLPDWIGFTPHGFVIAEAKGSHDRSNWHSKTRPGCKKPGPIENAQAQVQGVELVRNVPPYRSVRFKGWSVGSRWATETNGLDPWLMAIDPKLGDEPLSPDEFDSAKRAILSKSNLLMLKNMGFVSPEKSDIEIPIDQFVSHESFISLRLETGDVIENSIHAIAGPFGFIPVRNPRDVRFIRIAKRFRGLTSLISLSGNRLSGNVETSEIRRRDGLSIERNGFSLTPIDENLDLETVTP